MAGTITAPPFPPGSIHAPLTATERAEITAWIQSAVAYAALNGWSFSGGTGDFTALSDADLLKVYAQMDVVVNTHVKGITLNPFDAGTFVNPATGQDIQNPITSINQFLSKLADGNLWVRVGEFAIGGIVLAIGLNAVLRPGQSLSSGVGKIANPVGSGIKAVHNSAHGSFQ